jgi:hypothetical protein
LGAFVGDDAADAASSDDEGFGHEKIADCGLRIFGKLIGGRVGWIGKGDLVTDFMR